LSSAASTTKLIISSGDKATLIQSTSNISFQ
jgi:hypothetical protein